MAQVITVAQCGELLAMFLAHRASAGSAKRVANAIGYNDSPIFGARKKRLRLIAELACLYAAVAIYSANSSLKPEALRPVVDAFLSKANANVFRHIEAQQPEFKTLYELRLEEYFGLFGSENPPLGTSFSLMHHLGLNPTRSLSGQIWLAKEISDAAAETAKILERFIVIGVPDPAPAVAVPDPEKTSRFANLMERFMAETSAWPDSARLQAMEGLTLLMDGKGKDGMDLIMSLPRQQALKVTGYARELAALFKR